MIRLVFKVVILITVLPFIYVGWTAADIWLTSRKDERPRSDAIVVMGAAQYNGKPSTVFRARLDHAHELYDDKVAPLIVVLGGKREGDRVTEAQAGAAYLESKLPADKVTGVKSGSTTLDSFKKFTGLASERGIRTIVVVSDPLHLARAEEIASDLGFEVAVSGSHIALSRDRRREGLFKETMTLIGYRILDR